MANILALVSFKIFPPHMGGQKGVALFYESIARHHKIFMAASKDNIETIEATYQVRTILFPNKKIGWNLLAVNKIKGWISKEKIDCTIAEHSYTGWMAYVLKKITGRPFIIHSHNLETYRFRQMGRRWWHGYKLYEKWIHQKADHNFFISEEDKEEAVKKFSLNALKCTVIPYGVENFIPIANAKETLKKNLGLTCDYIFYFNGTLDYEPNIEAVENLIYNVDPLLRRKGISYKILISGKRLPQQIQNTIKETTSLVYLDYVSDINALYQGADIFLNTVVNNSGIKTKSVEALANHCTVISTVSGAAGIPAALAETKMITVADNNWNEFVNKIVETIQQPAIETPSKFFQYFSWSAIGANAADKIKDVVKRNE